MFFEDRALVGRQIDKQIGLPLREKQSSKNQRKDKHFQISKSAITHIRVQNTLVMERDNLHPNGSEGRQYHSSFYIAIDS